MDRLFTIQEVDYKTGLQSILRTMLIKKPAL